MNTPGKMHAPEHDWRYEEAAIRAERQDAIDNPDTDTTMHTPIEEHDEEDDCPHDENDHGICLSCHKDIFDDTVAEAEYRADCLNDR